MDATTISAITREPKCRRACSSERGIFTKAHLDKLMRIPTEPDVVLSQTIVERRHPRSLCSLRASLVICRKINAIRTNFLANHGSPFDKLLTIFRPKPHISET